MTLLWHGSILLDQISLISSAQWIKTLTCAEYHEIYDKNTLQLAFLARNDVVSWVVEFQSRISNFHESHEAGMLLILYTPETQQPSWWISILGKIVIYNYYILTFWLSRGSNRQVKLQIINIIVCTGKGSITMWARIWPFQTPSPSGK